MMTSGLNYISIDHVTIDQCCCRPTTDRRTAHLNHTTASRLERRCRQFIFGFSVHQPQPAKCPCTLGSTHTIRCDFELCCQPIDSERNGTYLCLSYVPLTVSVLQYRFSRSRLLHRYIVPTWTRRQSAPRRSRAFLALPVLRRASFQQLSSRHSP